MRNSVYAGLALLLLHACRGSGGDPFTSPVPLGSNARLAGLTLSQVRLDQIFAPTLTSYTATVLFLQSSTTVTPVTEDPNASFTVNGAAVESGMPSEPIVLDVDNNSIEIVVAAENGRTTETYTVEVLRQPLASLGQSAYLKASTVGIYDYFGQRLVLDGDTLAVAAPGEASTATGIDGDQSSDSYPSSGAVYVFTRDPGGVWSQQAYLKASNTGAGDDFGGSVALDGDTLVVGAEFEDSSATGVDGDQTDDSSSGSGAAYVFVRDVNGIWSQQAYLKASNSDAFDFFGAWVSIDGDTIVVGASGEASTATGVDGDQADNSGASVGAAYVFRRDSNGAWAQEAYLKASNAESNDFFGVPTALDGDTLVVGAALESGSDAGVNGDQSDNGAPGAGAVYVFTRDASGSWSQQAYLKASNPQADDFFGASMALDGDTLVVGAYLEDSSATGTDGNQLDNSASSAGAVYVFWRDATGKWSQEAYLKASNTDASDGFGSAIGLNGATLIVGAPGEDSGASGVNGSQTDNSMNGAGAVYVFTRGSGGFWSQQAYLKASNAGAGDFFGWVALDAGTLVVSAPLEDGGSSGAYSDQLDNSVADAGAVYTFR